MQFRKYEKIYRIGKDETEGILDVPCFIQEKVDGANLSVWIGDDSRIHVGSRNSDITDRPDGFNGAVKYCQENTAISNLLALKPGLVLYGEWLVRHTLQYRETAYRHFYLFDIYDTETGEYFSQELVNKYAEMYGIKYCPIVATLENPTPDELMKYVGGSAFGDKGEGVVIKPLSPFKNQFGDVVYAKIVTQEFKEYNAVTFGGNNRHSDTYWEMYFVNKYATLPRVEKIMNKLQPELDEKLDMKHVPRIMNTVYHDIVQEEGWDIFNDAPALDFKKFKQLVTRKVKQVYFDILSGNVSIADQYEKNSDGEPGDAEPVPGISEESV